MTEAELVKRSAIGDRAAQAELVIRCINKQYGDLTAFEAWSLAEPFARQAASHGLLDDRLMLSAVLRCRANHVADIGDVERGRRLLWDAQTLTDDLEGLKLSHAVDLLAGVLTAEAERGSEEAEALLDRITFTLSADDADALRNSINAVARELADEQAEAVHG